MLDAEVVRDDVKARRRRRSVSCAERPRARGPRIRFLAAHHPREIEAGHRRRGLRSRDGVSDIRIADVGRSVNAAVLRAALAQEARELAGVDVRDAHDVVRREVGAKIAGRAEIRDDARQVADHESRRIGPS